MLVLTVLAGGTAAFLAHDKAVRLSVDGHDRTLNTFAGDVTALLRQQGVDAGAHDLIAPGPRAVVADGDQVAVRHGRPLDLSVDGRRRRVWTTAGTVDQALHQLGVRARGSYVSVSRGAPIGRRGLDLDIRTERSVTFTVDGRERTVRTNAATVREAVTEAGIVLHGQDTISAEPGSFPHDGQRVAVTRISRHEDVRDEPIRYHTERHPDPSMDRGKSAVATPGRPGLRRVTYVDLTVNGVRQRPRRVASQTLREPATRVVRYGTRPLPSTVAGADGLNWPALAQCEAGGRPQAVDASGLHGGLYQFDTATWRGLGGAGRPQDAPAGEQTYRAKKLYVQRGAAPWPVCGRRLFQ
jgi:resuscitation-promoting factor RpfB